MGLDCDFEVRMGLQIVILKNHLWEKPGQVISPGGTEELLQLFSQNTEHCRTHQELWDSLGVENPTRVTLSRGSSQPLVPQSMGEAGGPWPWPVCVGGAGSSIPAHTPSTWPRVDLSWWASAAPAGSSLPSSLGCALGWLPELLDMAMGDVPVSALRVLMGLEAATCSAPDVKPNP